MYDRNKKKVRNSNEPIRYDIVKVAPGGVQVMYHCYSLNSAQEVKSDVEKVHPNHKIEIRAGV